MTGSVSEAWLWSTCCGRVDDDLDSLPIATARAIQLVAAAPAGRIDPRQIGVGGYYLAADNSPATARPSALLVHALKRRSQVAIVKYAGRGDRGRLGMLRPSATPWP